MKQTVVFVIFNMTSIITCTCTASSRYLLRNGRFPRFGRLRICNSSTDCFPSFCCLIQRTAHFSLPYARHLLSLHCYFISNSNFFPISSFPLSVVNSSFVGDTFFIASPTQGSNWNFRFLRLELNLSLSRCIFFANGMNGR